MDNWINRFYETELSESIKKGKVFLLYGPRRAGKTALLEKFIKDFKGKVYSGSGDDMVLKDLLQSQNKSRIISILGQYDLVFIDEAQQIPDVGLALKILIDNSVDMKLIITGSSSLGLSDKLGEPLTGRQIVRTLFPISVSELNSEYGPMFILEKLEELMIYGSYPEVLNSNINNEKIEYLITLRDSLLLKDILELENIRNPSKLIDLLRLLAFQIGHEVSFNELSNALGIAKQTVERYLNLLEKTFVIKKVGGFSRNLRKEITKTSRYYFWDNGIRNSVINNFNALNIRNDIGMLWENFLFIERLKKQEYQRLFSNNYFWRTYDGKEIDLIEEREGMLFAYEFKWGAKKTKPPKDWLTNYPKAEYHVIDKTNFHEFLI